MELHCTFGYSLDFYTCFVSSPEIREPGTVVKFIRGDHKPDLNDADVRRIEFHTMTHFIPRGLIAFFPNISSVSILNQGLTTICRDDLSQFPNLEQLWLNNNFITTLPDDLFENTPKVNAFSFYGNRIEFMTSKIFMPINNNRFKLLSFQQNTKIDAVFDPSSPISIPTVTKLMKLIDSQCSKPKPKTSSWAHDKISKALAVTHHEHSKKHYETLLGSGKFSDFVIVVNKTRRIHVHKCILAVQSEGFNELFDRDPKATEMKIEELRSDAVYEFIRYLYTGKLENFDDKSLEIFALASKLKVHELRHSMEKLVAGELDETNAFKAFSLAHTFHAENLKRAAFKKIQKMFPEKKLPEILIGDLQKVKEIIATKEKLDVMINNFELS